YELDARRRLRTGAGGATDEGHIARRGLRLQAIQLSKIRHLDRLHLLSVALREGTVLGTLHHAGRGHAAEERRTGTVDLQVIVGVHGAKELVATTERDVRGLHVGEVGELGKALLR